jgi:ribose 5-phosphate isomerase RpiB
MGKRREDRGRPRGGGLEDLGFGSNHNGFRLKEEIKKYLTSLDRDIRDYGVDGEDAAD